MNVHGTNQGAAGDVDIGTQNNYFGVNPATLPNSVPSIDVFVGREDYLADLREDYRNGARCFVLHGTGGVGKTALALRFAGEIAGDFKARVFVDMQGLSENALSARDAMLDVVRQFERDISADIPDAKLRQIFVQLVQNQPTLIVLDNARDKQSVEPLKLASACFITTSRAVFTLTNAEGSKKIHQMSPEDARKLLFEIAPENRFDGRADELARMAGYLPMALKPLASILAEDELETAADLIDRYRDRKELLKERVPDYDDLTVEASFGLSYDKLPAGMQTRWRQLSVFPADFDETAIAAVLDIPADEARETQKQLRRLNLLEVNPETRRFYLHDLARVFTDTKLSDNERFLTQFLHARYYAVVLYSTNEVRANDRENGYLAALKLIDAEWNNITTGQKWTAENTERNNAIAELCCHYSVIDLLSLRLHPKESIAWQTSSLKAAKKINNKIFEGNFSQNLGNAYQNLGDYRKAIEYYEQALNIAREISHRQGEGQCLGNLGNAYDSLGDYRKAIEYHEQSLEIKREIGDRLGEGINLGNLGNAYDSLGDYQKAIEYCEQSLKISFEIGDRLGEGRSLGNLGNAYNSLGKYQKAIEYHEQSLKIKREIGDRLGEGNSLGNLGNAYYRLGEREKACSLWKESMAILEAIESPNANTFRQLIEENCED